MKKQSLIISVAVMMLFVFAGCQNTKSRAVEGGVIGTVLGAAAGGIIGHQSGHGGEGAAIGAATGAIAGSAIGAQIEKPQSGTGTRQEAQAQSAAYSNPNQMSLQEIAELSRQGVSEAVIIDRIQLTNSRFTLTPADIDYLRQQGVSQRVIDVMQGY